MPTTATTTPVGARLAREPNTSVLQTIRVIVLRGRASLLQGPAALGNEDWQAFLQQHCKQPLPADFSQQLAQLAYAPDTTLRALPAEQRQHLFDTCKLWVEHHHVAA